MTRKAWTPGRFSHDRTYGTYAWKQLRLRILKRDRYLCQPCIRNNRPTPAHAVDHIRPKADGGTDAEANLQAICKRCHDEKTARDKGQTYTHKPKRVIGVDGWPVEE